MKTSFRGGLHFAFFLCKRERERERRKRKIFKGCDVRLRGWEVERIRA